MGFVRKNRKPIIAITVPTVFITALVISAVVVINLPLSSTHFSSVGYYSKFAVATDNVHCSELGKDILLKNGTAVDSALASMFCTCTFNFQSCGIGGGFFMVIHQKANSGSGMVMKEINSRETAPLLATPGMYNSSSSKLGGLSVGVPGQIKGSYLAWKEFGKLPWKDLLQPTINWLKNGFVIGKKLGEAIQKDETFIRNDPEFSKILLKPDGSLMKEGDKVKMPKLAATMEKIAVAPEDFYSGQMAEDVVKDIQEAGGIVSSEDLSSFKAYMGDAYKASIPGIGLTLHSISPPGGGPVIALMLKIMDVINMSKADLKDTKGKGNAYHRITEAMKFAFAGKTHLGDGLFVDNSEFLSNVTSNQFVKEIVSRITLDRTHPIDYYNPVPKILLDDKGTAHLSILAPDGSAVAMTNTINLRFGSKVIGSRTGILFNNEMDDFTLPFNRASYGTANLIEPGKRPMSSMIPSIYTDRQGKVRFVMGASGGPTILSSNFFSMTHRLWLNYSIEESVNILRFHHQLIPNKITYEKDFDPVVIDELIKKGHTVFKANKGSILSVIQAIENKCVLKDRRKKCITAFSDLRKGGKPAGY